MSSESRTAGGMDARSLANRGICTPRRYAVASLISSLFRCASASSSSVPLDANAENPSDESGFLYFRRNSGRSSLNRWHPRGGLDGVVGGKSLLRSSMTYCSFPPSRIAWISVSSGNAVRTPSFDTWCSLRYSLLATEATFSRTASSSRIVLPPSSLPNRSVSRDTGSSGIATMRYPL